jgi:hypothetical protein
MESHIDEEKLCAAKEASMARCGICARAGSGITLPLAVGQQAGTAPVFQPEELEQLLAPIALYPDSLIVAPTLKQFARERYAWTAKRGRRPAGFLIRTTCASSTARSAETVAGESHTESWPRRDGHKCAEPRDRHGRSKQCLLSIPGKCSICDRNKEMKEAYIYGYPLVDNYR